MIIIEGLDATGKSTLASRIRSLTGWPIQPSEGPEKEPGEIIKRIQHYFSLPDNTIFDRHPIISQYVYGTLAHKTLPPPYLLQELKRRDPFILEARPTNLGDHIVKVHDTKEHLQMILTQREKLADLYRSFFKLHFPLRHVYTFNTMEQAAQVAAAYARRKDDKTNS